MIMRRFRLWLRASRKFGAINPFLGAFDEADRAHLRLLEKLRETVVLLEDHEEAERIVARMAAASLHTDVSQLSLDTAPARCAR
jgi:hypothetical protein